MVDPDLFTGFFVGGGGGEGRGGNGLEWDKRRDKRRTVPPLKKLKGGSTCTQATPLDLPLSRKLSFEIKLWKAF